MKRIIIAAVIFTAGCGNTPSNIKPTINLPSRQIEQHVILTIDSSRWPNISQHTVNAQLAGRSITCTIDRPGAAARRATALRNVPTRSGFDRDEYPPAVCREGGQGADVWLVPSSENRSEGAWLESQIHPYSDGTVIEFTVSK
jgi:hypothetical protein